MSAYETLIVERQGPVGWLVFNRPQVGNAMNHLMMDELEAAWHELDDDPAVRVIVNTGEGRTFQTGLDIAELSRDPGRVARAVASHPRCRARLHRVAVEDLEAGDRGGQRHRRRRWAALRGRRRHRDRRRHRHVPRPPRLGRAGHRVRGDRAHRQDGGGTGHADGTHRALRADAGATRAYELGMVSQVVEPPEDLRAAAQELAEKVARTRPRRCARRRRHSGARWRWACGMRRSPARSRCCRCGAIPTRRKVRLAFAEKRDPRWLELAPEEIAQEETA